VKLNQFKLVQKFFESFKNIDGSLHGSYHSYTGPSEFEELLAKHLRELFWERIQAQPAPARSLPISEAESAALWKGNPYRGLSAFTEDDAPIFFGRHGETYELVRGLVSPDKRFVGVIGPSGSGKSSLVAAGLLPRLKAGDVSHSEEWVTVRFSPAEISDDPFTALATRLAAIELHPGTRPRELADRLRADPAAIAVLSKDLLKDHPETAEILLFIDQFEELFTLVAEVHRKPFVALLDAANQADRVRIVLTMRSDFYDHCTYYESLVRMLRQGSFPLAAPGVGALSAMIESPAKVAGLTLEAGLAQCILDDTGTEPGALPLMEFTLERLYDARQETQLTLDAYQRIGGIEGAITNQVETVEAELREALDTQLDELLPELFQSLLVASPEGRPTRRRAPKVSYTGELKTIVEKLISKRLLNTYGEGGESTVAVANEKLFDVWPTLQQWVEANKDDLRVVRQAEIEAGEWERHDYEVKYLWHVDRHKHLAAILRRLTCIEIDPLVARFAMPQEELFARLFCSAVDHAERLDIGLYLAELGDFRPGVGVTPDGVPDIDWIDILGGRVTLKEVEESFEVEPFKIASYPVTNRQFRAFAEAQNGYRNVEWWSDIKRSYSPDTSEWNEGNHPRESVSWYEAVAFCRWLSQRLGYEVRLPKEWEWQQAATGGVFKNEYPWGPTWNPAYCNSDESGLKRTTAVGMYPNGASSQCVLDMAGNVSEWCLNKFNNPKANDAIRIDRSDDSRVIRGGSWRNAPGVLHSANRLNVGPDLPGHFTGFRLAQDI